MLSTGTTLSARAQALIPALVTLLVVATLSPFADVVLPRMPLPLGEIQPRFQLFGLLLAAGPQVASLLVVTAATSLFGGYRLGVRVASSLRSQGSSSCSSCWCHSSHSIF